MNMKEYKLNIDPRILELLGPSLYTNIYYIIAELIANAYDADAHNVFCTQMNHIIIENGVRTVSSEDKRLGAYFVHLRDLVYNDKAKDNYDNEFEHLCFEEKTHDISDIDRQRLQEMRAAKRQNRRFPEKVLKYLWDDAFKFNRETVFDVTNYSSLEAVIRKFVDSEARDRMAVFNQTIVNTFTGTQQ